MEICDQVGFTSLRMVKQLLILLNSFCCLLSGGSTQCSFPKLFVSPRVCIEGDQEWKLLMFKGLQELDFQAV